MYVYVHMFWIHRYVCVHVYGDQSSASGIVPQVLPILFFETESPLGVELLK